MTVLLLFRTLLYSLSHNREKEHVLMRRGYEKALQHQDTLGTKPEC